MRTSSSRPESSAAPPSGRSQIITRSISKSRQKRIMSRLLPFRDRSSSFSGCPRIRDMLKKQHQRVVDHLNRDRTGEPKGYFKKNPNLKTIHGSHPRHTPESRHEALVRLGVIFSGQSRPPLTHHNFQQGEEEYARKQTLATAMARVAKHIKLPQRDLVSLLFVNRMVHNTLVCSFTLWQTLNLRLMNNAGDRLLSALTLIRYHNVEHIDLASAKGIEDKHLKLLKTKERVVGSLENLESLNLDCCENISNKGVRDVINTCPRLKKFSIGENLRVTDFCIKFLVKDCKCLTDLNLSGCKNLTDNSLVTIRNACRGLESLDITRCERVTDAGVIAIAEGCPGLKFLRLVTD
ncbi:hypothetical protein LIER_24202 [Lithospermum erythrorhizon]|uniref:F-box/LRR-repeat protein 15-like leucin rich repeat domain-containing protein n=1 Tax=Lithospermum erythrorhizon TaxID=34254 RepID=A0AAV3R3B2_LITER